MEIQEAGTVRVSARKGGQGEMATPADRELRLPDAYSEAAGAEAVDEMTGTEVTQEQVNDAYIQGAINASIDGLENSVYARQPKRPTGKP